MKKETIFIAAGYVLFLLVFFILDVTKANFKAFVALSVLTGVYALIVRVVKNIYEGSKKQ